MSEENENITAAHLEAATEAEYEASIQTFIDDDCDLIVCVGYKLAEATKAAAEANPDQKFAIVDDDTCAAMPNVACLVFKQEQAAHLAGVVAGMSTGSDVVGYVQGAYSDNNNKFAAGFIAGVRAVNDDAVILQSNLNSFAAPELGFAEAGKLIDQGADVIFHAAGKSGNGVIQACAERTILAIGVDVDQSYIAPDAVMASAIKKSDQAVKDIVKLLVSGSFTGGIHEYDLNNDGLGIVINAELASEETRTAIDQATADIKAGKITVPATENAINEIYPGAFTLQ